MTKQCLLMLAFVGTLGAAPANAAKTFASGDDVQDKYLWLEERTSEQALEWVRKENALTVKAFEGTPYFAPSFQKIHDILTSPDKQPSVRAINDGFIYNVWQDAKNPRGLLRRTSIEDFKNPHPAWTTILDLDALSVKENKPWVYKGIELLPGSDRALLRLSVNGQDAGELREFSLTKKTFIEDGFFVTESKSDISWVDENHVLLSSTLDPDDRTESGYARSVYVWTRGQKISEARRVYHADSKSVLAFSFTARDQGQALRIVGRVYGEDLVEAFLVSEDLQLKKIPVSEEAQVWMFYQGQFLFTLKKPWGGYAVGSVLAAPLTLAGASEIPKEQISVVFTPSEHSAYSQMVRTKNRLYMMINENVKARPYEVHFNGKDHWSLTPMASAEGSSYFMEAMDSSSDTLAFTEEGYLQPRRTLLQEGTATAKLKPARSWFDEAKFVTEQHWVKSKDGVEIPYTLIRLKDFVANGQHPTVLYGYGGFEISLSPSYSAIMGSQWLENGGVYVVANIRGGGEFGPAWHRAAILENKQKSYDDFIAIAEDLIARKITSPRHLGIRGGSNGGLLVGAVAMQRPDLFNAVVCQVPLLDMIRYVEMPPGASWMSEYGDPREPKMREAILKYSPYQNISPTKKYPKIFFETSQADDRVHPGHARKMVARMKELGHNVYFYEPSDGGHGGDGSNLEDQARTQAYLYAYLLSHLR